MKRSALFVIGVVIALPPNMPIAAESLSGEIGPHHRVIRSRDSLTLPSGRVIERPTGYAEIAVGMHYQENGRWLPSREEIELFQDGAVARHGPYSVIFAPNITTAGAIDLMTPDGLRLRSHVLGLGLHDNGNGNSTLLAETTDSVGQLHAPNVIIYPSAFDDVAGDLRYTYRQNRFSQDVILRQKIIMPPGFDANSTDLEIWTEFIAPAPGQIVSQKADAEDETLIFESMRIGPGRAFALEANGLQRSIPVVKRWIVTEGRSFLVEAVKVAKVNAELDRMGIREAAFKKNKNANIALAGKPRPFPKAPDVRDRNDTRRIETAMLNSPRRGFVIDYDLSGTIATLRLQGDTTYCVTNDVTVTHLIIEGGTVVKFKDLAGIFVSLGSVTCETDPYRPAIFTSKNDDTVGAGIAGSTGNPTPPPSGYEWPFIYFSGTTQLDHVRFSYGNPAVYTDGAIVTLRHAQFVHCASGVWSDNATFKLQNVLMHDMGLAIVGIGWIGKGEHVTVSTCDQLGYSFGGSPTLALTNSLLVNVTNLGVTPTTNLTLRVAGAGILQTVGAGAAYLATNSPYRDIGTTNIDVQLLREVRKMTTFPPLTIESSGTYTNNLDLLPQAQRDFDTPDLGYHYYAMDFVISNLRMTNATLTASNGVVIGTRKGGNMFGIAIGDAAHFLSKGSPDVPNHILRYNMVQEQATTNWATSIPEIRMITGFENGLVPSHVSTRFTHWSTHASGGEHFYSFGTDNGTHTFTHSEFHNHEVISLGPMISFTNCLFNRANFTLIDIADSISPNVRHCTFRGGTHNIARGNGGTWTFKDNLFDAVAIPVKEAVLVHDYNAYTTNSARLTNSAPRDIVLAVTNVTFQAGTLGRFYLPTNLSSHWPLISTTNVVAAYAGGSTNANLLGLFHFTSTPNNVKETNTVVDIGYHYVATDGNGLPLDGDGDGWSDYHEDGNGNGSLDSAETNWQNPTDQGLRVWITRPKKGLPLP